MTFLPTYPQYLGWNRPLRLETPDESAVLRTLRVADDTDLPENVDWVAKGKSKSYPQKRLQ